MKFLKELQKPKSLHATIADDLHQAQLDRLQAKASAEHWQAMADMLDMRVERLEQALRDNK